MSSTPRRRSRPKAQTTLPEPTHQQVDREGADDSGAEADTEKPKDCGTEDGLTTSGGDDPTDRVVTGTMESEPPGTPNEAAPGHGNNDLINPTPLTSTPAVQKGRKGFLPGKSGNPNGRPKGSKNKTAQFAKARLEEAQEAIVLEWINMALDGNPSAMKSCIDRLYPCSRSTPDGFELPPIQTIDDIQTALACLTDALARGDTDTETAGQLIKLIQLHRESFESSELAAELAELRKEVDTLK